MSGLGSIFGSAAGDTKTDYDVTIKRDLDTKLDSQDMKVLEGMKALQLIELKSDKVPLTKHEQDFLDGTQSGRESVQKDITRKVNGMLQGAQQGYQFEDGSATLSKDSVKDEYARLLRNETSNRTMDQAELESTAQVRQPARTNNSGLTGNNL